MRVLNFLIINLIFQSPLAVAAIDPNSPVAQLLTEGCAKNDPQACLDLGLMYLEVKDQENARKHLVTACKLGARTACKIKIKI